MYIGTCIFTRVNRHRGGRWAIPRAELVQKLVPPLNCPSKEQTASNHVQVCQSHATQHPAVNAIVINLGNMSVPVRYLY